MSDYKIDIPIKIKFTLDKLHDAGKKAYLVGGCVRDALLGISPHDWDIATSATPEEIKNVFRDYKQIDTGLKHGTVAVIIENKSIEITTFRIDGKYSDGRRPDKVSFTTNITEDLSRRDYSINACAITDNQIIDPFGGQEDIKNHIIRCVGDPMRRFNEDALRILRGIRFASVLNFEIEEYTKEAMFELKNLLRNISQERITAEFCKTLLGINVRNTLMEYRDILVFILPEIKDTIGFNQNNNHHIYDVFEHSLMAVESTDSDIILRVCMLFHDIAKPYCYSLDQNKVGHFYGHPEKSAQMTEAILKRMRFQTKDIHDITQLIKYHDMQIESTPKSIKKCLNAIGKVQFNRLLKVKRADILAQNPDLAFNNLKDLSVIEQIFNDIISSNNCVSMRDLAINGYDLILLGIPEGKEIGIVLNKLLEMVLSDEIKNDKDALSKMVSNNLFDFR